MAVTCRALGPEPSAAEEKKDDVGLNSRKHTRGGKKRNLSRNEMRKWFFKSEEMIDNPTSRGNVKIDKPEQNLEVCKYEVTGIL